MKKIIMSIAMLALATSLFAGSTFAWFSMNKEVTASNMKVKAKVSSSLVITTSALPTSATTSEDVDFKETTANGLYNSTHDSSTTSTTGLKTLTSDAADRIDKTTGKVKTGETALGTSDFENAANVEGGKQYYKDYVVYVSALNEALANQNLSFSMTYSSITNTINNAISADIYCCSATSALTASGIFSSTNYVGTLNVAGLKPDGSAAQTSVSTSAAVTVPVADGKGAIAVLFRVYLDGNLSNGSTGNAYVNTAKWSTSIEDVTLNFTISASTAASK